MYLSWIFWAALALPGFVLARRFSRDDLECGFLGTMSVSYFLTLAILSPFSILCYLLHAPLVVFSLVVAIAVIYSAIEIVRRGWWRDLRGLFVGIIGIELLVIAVDLVMSARVGAFIHGDARIHLARIRFLLDNGFSNYDPFVSTPYFFPIYHTNILHALYAACAQITRVDYLSVWFASLVWGKLLVAGSAYYMVWCTFERRWAAWVAAMFTIVIVGPTNFVIYPNKLAPLWLMPMMIAFAIQAFQSSRGWRPSVKLGMGALILGQVHGLYAGFAVILLGPVLGGGALYRIIRRHQGRWWMAASTAALALGLPFIVITKLGMTTSQKKMDARARPVAVQKDTGSFRHLDNGQVMLNPKKGMGRQWAWRYLLLGAGAVYCVVGPHRRRAGVVVAVVGVAAVVLYTPPLCTALRDLVGQTWALGRLRFIFGLTFVVLAVGSGFCWLEPRLRTRWARAAAALSLVLFAIPYANLTSAKSWPRYYTRFQNDWVWRSDRMNRFRAIRTFCEENIPPGSNVLIDQGNGVTLAMACDCHIVASYSASNGVPDLAQRRKDLSQMLNRKTPWNRRRELLDKYGITHVLSYSPSVRWARGRVKAYWRGEDGVFVELADDLDSTTVLPPRGPDSAFRIGVRNLNARLRIANALADIGARESALAEFQQSAKKYGKSAKAQYKFANALAKAGDLHAAMDSYRRAIKLKPKAAYIRYSYANTLIKLGHTSEAVDEYREALRLQPEHARASKALAAALKALGDSGTR